MLVRAQITIMYSNPVVVALLAWAFRGELLSLQGSIGTAITLLGVVIVAQPPFLFGGDDWTGTRMAGAEPFISVSSWILYVSFECEIQHNSMHQ